MDNNKLKDYLQDLVNQKIIHSDVRDDILHLAHIKKQLGSNVYLHYINNNDVAQLYH